ncbi:MAG: hypothetical protein R2940_03925 [Syntrophotaleaceae bacterium]
MTSSHFYDLIIIGTGLAGRMLALALSAGNRRVLILDSPASPVPAALPATPVMARIATVVDPSGSSLRSARSFQVITPDVRLEVHGPRSLEEEMLRELPNPGRTVLNRLGELEHTGRRLEELLLNLRTPPSLGLKGRLAYSRSLFLKGLAGKGLGHQFSSVLKGISDESARQFLSTLFCGLTLADPQRLTIGEAALFWHAASRTQVFDGPALAAATERRLRDSGIQVRPFGELASLHGGGKRPWEVSLRDGTRLGADRFIIDRFIDPVFLADKLKPAIQGFSATREYWHLSGIQPVPSSLLARNVMLAGDPALLLNFFPSPVENREIVVEQAGSLSRPLISEHELRLRLEPLLPFSEYRLEKRRRPAAASRAEAAPVRFGPSRVVPGILLGANSIAGEGLFDIHFPLTTWLTCRAVLKQAL